MTSQSIDVRNLERTIERLERTDLSKETLDSIVGKISGVHDIFTSFGIGSESELFQRLDKFTDAAEKYFSPRPASNGDIRSYAGVSGNYKLFYNYVDTHAFLGRIYHEQDSTGRIKVDWRFNLGGRIEFVDSRLYPEGKTCHLMGYTDRKKEPVLWEEGLFWYNRRLPGRLGLIAGNFFKKSLFKRYSTLLRFGHATARQLIENLENENVLDSYKIRDGQKQLKELSGDSEALRILEKAAVLYPRISGDSDDYFVVEYRNFSG